MRAPDDPIHAYIALGANKGNVEITLAEALWAIDGLPQTTIRAQSAFYRTPPWGLADQPAFINAVVEIRTRMTAAVVLQQMLEIERRFGRVRRPGQQWGPRELDLDLLLYGNEQIDVPGLHVPHPRLHERAFVLVPLAEIAPNLDIPGRGRVSDLLAAVDASGIEAMP